jgi:hypothetical protein
MDAGSSANLLPWSASFYSRKELEEFSQPKSDSESFLPFLEEQARN